MTKPMIMMRRPELVDLLAGGFRLNREAMLGKTVQELRKVHEQYLAEGIAPGVQEQRRVQTPLQLGGGRTAYAQRVLKRVKRA